MKGYESASKAVDEIVSAISEIHGCDSNGDECIVGSSDEIVSFEHLSPFLFMNCIRLQKNDFCLLMILLRGMFNNGN